MYTIIGTIQAQITIAVSHLSHVQARNPGKHIICVPSGKGCSSQLCLKMQNMYVKSCFPEHALYY